jgi:hypothetical protein
MSSGPSVLRCLDCDFVGRARSNGATVRFLPQSQGPLTPVLGLFGSVPETSYGRGFTQKRGEAMGFLEVIAHAKVRPGQLEGVKAQAAEIVG